MTYPAKCHICDGADIKRSRENCQVHFLSNREAVGLKERLREAYGIESIEEIAQKLGYKTYQGLDHVIKGRNRITDDRLLEFHRSTGRSIHWLLTGQGEPSAINQLDENLQSVVKQIGLIENQDVVGVVSALVTEGLRARASYLYDRLLTQSLPLSEWRELEVLMIWLQADAAEQEQPATELSNASSS